MNTQNHSLKNSITNLDHKGFHTIKNFLNIAELKVLNKLVDKNLKVNNHNSFFITNDDLKKTFIGKKKFLNKFYSILHKLSTLGKLNNFNEKKIYKNLRVISRSKMHSNSFDFHFDAHKYTILVPIKIPRSKNENQNGDLIIFPNLRNETTSLTKNIFYKIIFQSKIIKILLKFLTTKNLIKKIKIKLKPGNIYIFNGFKSLHGNEPVGSGLIRATLLLHYYDLFEDSLLVSLNRNFRKYIERNNIKKNKVLKYN